MDAPTIPPQARRALDRFETLRAKADALRDEVDAAAHEAARLLRGHGLTLRQLAGLLGRPDAPISHGQAERMLDGRRSPRCWDGRSVLARIRRREVSHG